MNQSAKTISILLAICSLILFASVCSADGPYRANWESLKKIPVPQWFDDAKLGIFSHWGPYSVAGFRAKYGYSEHFAQFLYRRPQEHKKFMMETFGGMPPNFGYKDLIPFFKAEKFDADEWAELLKKAGAQYVIPVGEHHDGFAMWDSELTQWDAKEKGPKRDVIGELEKAVRAQDMQFGVSYHRERHFGFFGNPKHAAKVKPHAVIEQEIAAMPECSDLYGPFGLTNKFIEDYIARWKEIERKYQPDFMWIDDIPVFYNDKGPQVEKFRDALKQMIADYLNQAQSWGKPVYLNNKGKRANWPDGVGCRSADNMAMNSVGPKWENPATLGHSYAYCREEDEQDQYKSVTTLVHLLCDVVSKNGTLLLNIGPKADGTISENQKKRLLGIGQWLEVNGEAIYSTRPWVTFGEGLTDISKSNGHLGNKDFSTYAAENIRFTRSKDNKIIYAIFMNWPSQGKKVIVRSFAKDAAGAMLKIKNVSLLGYSKSIQWSRSNRGLLLKMPAVSANPHANVFKIELQ